MADEYPDRLALILSGASGPAGGHAEPAQPARAEYYSDITLSLDADPPRIDFVRAHGADVPPPEMRNLRRQIEDVARLVRMLFQDDRRKLVAFFGELHITAWSGLQGRNYSVEVGADNLQDVKDSIADAFPVIRGRIWMSNLVILLVVAPVCGAAAAAVFYLTGLWNGRSVAPDSNWPQIVLAALLIPIGVAIGLFAEFALRVNDDIPFDQLSAINPGRWKPLPRAVNTLVIAYVFAWLIGLGAFKIGVANVLLNDFIGKDPGLSLAIGFITGFAFPYVRDIVQKVRPTVR